MHSSDRFLPGIVAGVVILILVALGVALLQPKPTYRSDDTPEAVVYNYILAFRQEDYARAYSYLAPSLKGYPPDLQTFQLNVLNNRYNFQLDNRRSYTIEDSPVLQKTSPLIPPVAMPLVYTIADSQVLQKTAVVRVREHVDDGFLLSGYSDVRVVTLRQEGGAWKIASSGVLWFWCWDSGVGCK